MTAPVRRPYPDLDDRVSRAVLAQLDEAAPCAEHWKILITAVMGFFADAYDLFIIGVAATLITAEWHITSYQKSLPAPEDLAILAPCPGHRREISVAAVPMPVLTATDLAIAWLASFSEHHADFAGTLTYVRPLREQVDWSRVRAETAGSAFAAAFFVLLRELRILTGEEER